MMKPRIIYLPLVFIALLAMWTTSSAQQTALTEKQKLVLEFRKLTGADNVNLRVNLSFEDVRNELVATVDNDKELTEAEKSGLRNTAIGAYNGLDQQLKAFLNDQTRITPIAEAAVFEVYDKAFTETDLKELIAFYSTATGQKALKFLPTLSNQVGQLFQSMLLPKVQEFIGPKIKAETEQLKQRIADAKTKKPE